MAPESSPSAKPPGAGDGKSTTTKPAAAKSGSAGSHPASASASRSPGRRSRDEVSDDPCAGLDGAELDDCLGFDAGDSRDEQRGRDFAAEQRQRDRSLMERDAREAAQHYANDEPPYDEGDDTADPQDDPPPDDYDRDDDGGYDPGDDELPPDDDSNG